LYVCKEGFYYNAVYDLCISETCGDGVIQRGDCTGFSNCEEVPGTNEVCDDGHMNGEYGYCAIDCMGYAGA